MRAKVKSPGWFGDWLVLFTALALFAVHGCARKEKPPISWASPRMREIEKDWQALQETYDRNPEIIPGENGKDKYSAMEKLGDRIFEQQLSDDNLRQLDATCNMLPADAANKGFSAALIAFMVKSFANSGDRESLVQLLAVQCPDYTYWPVTIENYLVNYGKKLKDPILVLGEANSRSQSPQARHALAAAVRRAFVDQGIQGKDDSEYVANAMKWYEAEKGSLVVNWRYVTNEMASPFTVHGYEKDPQLYDNPKGFSRYPLLERKTATERK